MINNSINIIKKIKKKIVHRISEKQIKTIAICAAQVPFSRGGAEEHVEALARELKVRGYEADIINIPFKWYPDEQLFKSMELWKNIDLSESDGKPIDLVIATKFPSYFINHHNKVLWLIHQYRQAYDLLDTPYSGFDLSNKKQLKQYKEFIKLDNKALKTYNHIYTNSVNTSKRLKKYNNINSSALYHPPKLYKKYFNSDLGDYILSVGRLEPLKRVDLLIKSLKYCDMKIKCKIVGRGSEMETLKKLSKKLGVSDRVEFLGFVSDDQLIELYANCAFVFFAPLDEDYGYITLEAFLSKKTVITAIDSGGPLEFVKNNINGIVLESLEEKKIAEKVESLFFDREKCVKLGVRGFDEVKDISWDNVINTLIEG
jgi:glycosyltransferase involved in cell wall biosynthesis